MEVETEENDQTKAKKLWNKTFFLSVPRNTVNMNGWEWHLYKELW